MKTRSIFRSRLCTPSFLLREGVAQHDRSYHGIFKRVPFPLHVLVTFDVFWEIDLMKCESE